ncbi:helix-turn-helix domain-containing protein [Paenibacillus sp. 1P07SE]|uniref:helix-turn-helix domain-containing protein n=1 Tax=Paenibacillus sp. 1P07SE TaxID=3132209 RepID=UPI0039A5C9A9
MTDTSRLVPRRQAGLIFAKRFLKYFLVLAILIAMVMPLYYKSYALAKQLTIDQSAEKLQGGMLALEQQVMRAQEIARLLRQEDEFKRLFFLQGPPTSDYYVDFHELQIKLKSLSLTQDMFSNVYLMFRDNPVFISNYISSDDYNGVYGTFYNYKDLSVEAWHGLLFEDNASIRFLPARETYSSYYSRSDFQSVTALLNMSYYNAFDQKSVLVIDFDQRELLSRLLSEDQIGNHIAYVADNDDNLLLSHNYEENGTPVKATGLQELATASGHYIALTQTSDLLGMHAVVGIPVRVFEQHVNALLELVLFYIIAGSGVILLLLVLFSMKETLGLTRLLEAASRSANTMFKPSNEYAFIDNAFTKMSTIHEEQRSRIDELNRSIQHSVLKQLLMLGIYTEREKQEVESYFGSRFDAFAVIKIRYSPGEEQPEDRTAQHSLGLRLKQAIHEVYGEDAATLDWHAKEMVAVLFLTDTDPAHLSEIKQQSAEVIRQASAGLEQAVRIQIGVSRMKTEMQQAKSAYQEALHALSSQDDGVSSGVYVPVSAAEREEHADFDIAILLKLYDALIAGERTVVSQLLDDAQAKLSTYPPGGAEQLQIFYSLRQTVSNARHVLLSGKPSGEGVPDIMIPVYEERGDLHQLASQLRLAALGLCEAVADTKKSNNEKLKRDILHYIEAHYDDPALSAASIATVLMISEKYVFSFVKEQTGKSLGKYIEAIRIGHAERLLLETDEPNSRILKRCGFGSENTFYRAFAKKHVVSPTVWRENRKQRTP